MDSAKVSILEKTNKVGFRCLLESQNGAALETQVSLEVLSDFTNQTLEGQLSDQKLGALLVATDLTKSHSSRSESVRLLDATGCGS